MLEYLDYLEKRQNLQRTHLDREFFEKVNGWLDAAEALAQDEPLARVHIGWERVIVDRTMYQNLNTLVQLGYHPDYAKVLARFKENLLAQLNGWSPLKTYRKLSARLAVAEQEADLYSHFPVKIPAQFEGCEVLDMHWSELKGEAVKDPDAVCGTARHNPKYKHEKPTYSIGFYNAQLRSGNGLHFTPENTPQDEKFHLYRLGRTRIITPLYIHYDNLWHYRQELSTIGILGEEREIWVSMKFAGPLYVQGSKSKNQVLFDRVLLVNDPNPLRRYKPLDPSRNLLANGGFETYSENRMEQWGQTTPQCGIDTEVKHSGNASLRIHNAPQNYASVRFSLGRIKDLKDDLLIRGWVKYANILSGPQYSMPILALWSINDQGKNSYSLPLMEFFPGTYDWHSFETVVKIEEFKASCNRHKVPPTKAQFHVGLYHQPGSLWVDDLEIIPLEKAK